MIGSLKVLYLERMNPIKCQSDHKDSWHQKCSLIQKSLTKNTDNQSMPLLIRLSNCVPSIPEENFMRILLSVVDQPYSKDSSKDYKLGFREELIKDWLSLRKFQKLRYILYFIQSAPINVQVLENPYQRYAVWLGGSLLANSPGFGQMYHTRD